MSPDKTPQSLGKRVAALRGRLGWTQQDLADRLAVSRVAVSHIEAGLRDPSERTVTLLAGIFKLEPWELVAGTGYPTGKAERLPLVACRYTEVEFQVGLLEAELERGGLDATSRARWAYRLAELARNTFDRHERALLTRAKSRLEDY